MSITYKSWYSKRSLHSILLSGLTISTLAFTATPSYAANYSANQLEKKLNQVKRNFPDLTKHTISFGSKVIKSWQKQKTVKFDQALLNIGTGLANFTSYQIRDMKYNASQVDAIFTILDTCVAYLGVAKEENYTSSWNSNCVSVLALPFFIGFDRNVLQSIVFYGQYLNLYSIVQKNLSVDGNRKAAFQFLHQVMEGVQTDKESFVESTVNFKFSTVTYDTLKTRGYLSPLQQLLAAYKINLIK